MNTPWPLRLCWRPPPSSSNWAKNSRKSEEMVPRLSRLSLSTATRWPTSWKEIPSRPLVTLIKFLSLHCKNFIVCLLNNFTVREFDGDEMKAVSSSFLFFFMFEANFNRFISNRFLPPTAWFASETTRPNKLKRSACFATVTLWFPYQCTGKRISTGKSFVSLFSILPAVIFVGFFLFLVGLCKLCSWLIRSIKNHRIQCWVDYFFLLFFINFVEVQFYDFNKKVPDIIFNIKTFYKVEWTFHLASNDKKKKNTCIPITFLLPQPLA